MARHFQLVRAAVASVATALVMQLALASTSASAPAPFDEYQLKAAFLFHFTRFVEWPGGRAPDAPIVIGILGLDPFGAYLDETLKGEQVKERALIIQRYRKPQEDMQCDILFISSSEADRLAQILGKVRQREMLTVSDVKDFARQGGIIELWTDQDRVRLKVNIAAARDAHLTISSKLLRSAETVDTEQP